MKALDCYQRLYGRDDINSVFNQFMANLKSQLIDWQYFVDWNRVFDQVQQIEVDLNCLNYLIGKADFAGELKKLLIRQPQLVRCLPLLAVRSSLDRQFRILANYQTGRLEFVDYDFTSYNPDHFADYLKFMESTGLQALIQDRRIKNLVDYMIGVEAGLNSNARKNRTGHTMEKISQFFLEDLCHRKGYHLNKEVKDLDLRQRLGARQQSKDRRKRYDFLVETPEDLIVFEVNFYNSSGSKLKSTAGEYRGLPASLGPGVKFVWLTDGEGWLKSAAPLREAFEDLDYIFNLDLLERGVLLDAF